MNNLTPHIRRQVEEHIDKSIMAIYDDIHWTQKIRTKEELKIRMEWVIRIRKVTIKQLIWNLE